MVITRTPFRISFAGGGSDLEAFYSHEPGCVFSTAINQYMYITVKQRPGKSYRISYSQTEITDRIDDIQHPIVRECLRRVPFRKGLEVVSMADLPAQSGMGSSSSFTVGLLHALYALDGKMVSANTLARMACQIEIDTLKTPIGKQDQYIAAYGGMQTIQFLPGGEVFVDPVIVPSSTRNELSRRLLLFFTGMTRSASDVLTKQVENTPNHLSTLRQMCELAREMRNVIIAGRDLNDFGKLLHISWELKRSLTHNISNPQIDSYYERAIEAGALGGKLLGAGNGGFILLYCEPHRQNRVREALCDLEESPFALEPQGSKIIYVDDMKNDLETVRFS